MIGLSKQRKEIVHFHLDLDVEEGEPSLPNELPLSLVSKGRSGLCRVAHRHWEIITLWRKRREGRVAGLHRLPFIVEHLM